MGTKICLWIGTAGFAGDLLLEAEPSELPLGSLFLALALISLRVTLGKGEEGKVHAPVTESQGWTVCEVFSPQGALSSRTYLMSDLHCN